MMVDGYVVDRKTIPDSLVWSRENVYVAHLPVSRFWVASPMSLNQPLVLASQSPRRRELLEQAGYEFEVVIPDEQAECGICTQTSPDKLVARLAWRKAADVAPRVAEGIVIGCDTVAECLGRILGKPVDEDHAREMLRLLRGQQHRVYSGLCVWRRPDDEVRVDIDVTTLTMQDLSDDDIEAYLETGGWEGKAGAFGYQDGLPWLRVVAGSESNVVGLPMELLERMLSS
jgi:septum formation protein